MQREARRRYIGAPWRQAYTVALVELLGEHGTSAPNIESHAAAQVMADARFGLATPAELERWSVEVEEADPHAPAPDYWEREDRQRREAVSAWAARPAAVLRAVVSVTVTALRPTRATRTTRRTTVRRVSSFAGGTSSGERDDGGGGEPPSSSSHGLRLPVRRSELRRAVAVGMVRP